MAEQRQYSRAQIDFTFGLYTRLGTDLSPANSAYRLQNADVRFGGFRCLPGTSLLNASKIDDKAVVSQYRAYVRISGTLVKVAFATAGTKMYYWDGTDYQELADTLTDGEPWSFVTYNQLVYCTNGFEAPKKITIVGDPAVSAPTIANMAAGPAQKCKQFIVVGDLVFAGVNDTEPWKVWPCDVGTDGIATPEAWTSTNWVAFPSVGKGQEVTALGEWKNHLVGATETTVSMLFGSNPYEFEVVTVDSSRGCLARQTFISFGEFILFLGRKGLYAWAGGEAKLISGNIQPQLDDVNQTYIGNAVAIADETSYHFSYTSTAAGGAVNNRTIIFDVTLGNYIEGLIKGGFYGPHTIGAASFSYWSGEGDKGEIYYGDASATGFVHKYMDTSSKEFSGENINMVVETGNIDWRRELRKDRKKHPTWTVVTAEPEGDYDITVGYSLNDASAFTTLDTISMDTTGEIRGDMNPTSETRTIIKNPMKYTANIVCYFMRLQFSYNNKGFACVVRNYEQWAVKGELDRA